MGECGQVRGAVVYCVVCSVKVMMMVGVRPVPDALGRVNKLEVIPLEELGRPRIDVVVNCSGVFRDLFVNQVCSPHSQSIHPHTKSAVRAHLGHRSLLAGST